MSRKTLDAAGKADRRALRLMGESTSEAETVVAREAALTRVKVHATTLKPGDAAATAPVIDAAQATPRMRTFIAADTGLACRATAVPVLAM